MATTWQKIFGKGFRWTAGEFEQEFYLPNADEFAVATPIEDGALRRNGSAVEMWDLATETWNVITGGDGGTAGEEDFGDL